MSNRKIKIKLFWKILILFWLIFVAILSFNLFFTHLNSDVVRYRKLPPHLHHQLKKTQRKLAYLLKEYPNGEWGKRKFLRNAFLLDGNGNDYLGKRRPDILDQLHHQVLTHDRPMTGFKKQALIYGGSIFRLNGVNYRLYISERFSILSRGYFSVFIREFAHNLLISTFFISFPLSFLLAWIFSRPIRQLQSSIKEMSLDISDRNKLSKLISRRDEFGDLARDFDAMASHLDNVINSKTRLLSDVSHELKSPLARLQLALGLAKNKASGNEIMELDRIKLEADRMNQMISGLLEYSKMQSEYSQGKKESFAISELLSLVVYDAKFESLQKSISINTDFQEDLYVNAIKSMLLSSFENIIRNAIRYAENEIRISCKAAETNEQIIITICDDGQGVDDSRTEKIFEAFYRPQHDRSRQSGGVGLGLSIAKKAIQAHNGSIVAKNISPHGLLIEITLVRIFFDGPVES